MDLIRWLLPSRRGSSLGRYDAAWVFESQESKDRRLRTIQTGHLADVGGEDDFST